MSNLLTVDMTLFTLQKTAVLELEDGTVQELKFTNFEKELPVLIAGNNVTKVNFIVFEGYDILQRVKQSFDFSIDKVNYNVIEVKD